MIDKKLLNKDVYLLNALKIEIDIMKKLKGRNIVRFIDNLETLNN